VEPPVNISEPLEIGLNWTPSTPGEHTLTVEVDPSPGNVSESNPWNNTANVTVEVEDNRPDLLVEIEDVVYEGGMVTVKVNITNIGHETHDGFLVRFSVDGRVLDERWVKLGGHTLSMSFTSSALEAGEHTLIVEANPADTPAIQDEITWANNQDSAQVEVPEPTPTPTFPARYPGGGGGGGGGDLWGSLFGEGTGQGEGSGTGSFTLPVNETQGETGMLKHTEKGYRMGEELAGSAGGGGKISYIWILIVTLTLALVIYGYWREHRFGRGGV
ncbi:MAG TPA: hypothetical protein ENG09_05055, partial [Candidatus Syntrophoarchaeum butanivorans]|nr:hypothetical protein [Candidatus Syntrophoarchaeum butanivorans]